MATLLSNITSSLAGTAAAAGSFGHNTLAPALGEAGKAALKLGQEHVVPALSGAAEHVKNMDIKQVGPAVVAAGSWMAAHPGQTALHAVSVSTLVFPGLVAGPLLWATGFASTGVQGGESVYFVQFTFIPQFVSMQLTGLFFFFSSQPLTCFSDV